MQHEIFKEKELALKENNLRGAVKSCFHQDWLVRDSFIVIVLTAIYHYLIHKVIWSRKRITPSAKKVCKSR